jgi:catechol 2,3-dioxygenase-like lactoylglutathione lyase family enzyme
LILNFRHTGIVVENLPHSLDFYQGLLGFQVEKQANEAGPFIDAILGLEQAALTTVKLRAPDGVMIELLDFGGDTTNQGDKPITEVGPTHLAFGVADLDDIFVRLQAKGIKFISNPQVSPDGYAKVAFCRAPEGTHIELVELL